MSQHDYNIANQTFSATRTDLNNALGAVATNNAGNSAPSTTYASQWWFDSDGNTLYLRNKDNDAWCQVFTIGATSDKIENLGIDSLTLGGATPTLTIGDGGAEDAKIIFDGNAQNFHIGLDDSGDKLTIGLGNALGTYPGFTMDENTNVEFPDNSVTIVASGNGDNLTLKTTDTDDGIGPNLRLYRAVAGAANDSIGTIDWAAQDVAGNLADYASIAGQIIDATDGSEDGTLTFKVMNAGSLNQMLTISGPETVVNEGSKDHDFRVESDNSTKAFFVSGTKGNCHITGASSATKLSYYSSGIGNLQFGLGGAIHSYDYSAIDGPYLSNNQYIDNGTLKNIATGKTGRYGMYDGQHIFSTSASQSADASTTLVERMRITNAGDVHISRTVDGSAVGISLREDGIIKNVVDGNLCFSINRKSDDGNIMAFQQDGSEEGTISVSGTTVSYNGFTGSHWSRLADNSKPTILRGTIMDSIDEMCDWYQAVADVAEVKYTAEDSEVIDGDKNVGDVKTEAHKIIEEIALPSDKSVGDAVTFTSNGVEYTGKYVKEGDVKHVKSKVSDTADSTKIYGVFSHWDEEAVDTVNDMFVSQVGTYIIRVHKDITIAAGDLLVSNGDGTAKKQDDDIIRSKTVAKVNSTVKIETYADGSYTVPCTLHC